MYNYTKYNTESEDIYSNMAEILKGAPVAAALTEKLIARSQALKVKPMLAILRVGNKPDDISYETGIIKRCEKIGIEVKKIILPEDCEGREVIESVKSLNNDKAIHGVLIFRPLSDKATEQEASKILSPAKDVDCMTQESLASVFTGSKAGYPPCTAQACIELMDHYGIELEGKNIVVIGRSLVIGKPLSIMLQNRNATVTMCHSKTRELPEICKRAEIIVAAIGKAGFVDSSFVAPGQVVIDVGINLDANGKLCGDVKFDEVEPIVKAITPVPAGVGSVTTSVLAKHVIEACEQC